MDSGSSSLSAPINKRWQNANYEGVDMISNLPDSIIGRILSFLPTKEAVRTCVISKRWKPLWTFITKLEFHDTSPSFLYFVYTVLNLLHASSIESLSLSLSESYHSHHINQWIFHVLNRGAKELYINSKEKLYIWDFLWKSRSLEKLVLKMKLCAFIVPTFVSLSSLTVLKLSGITFRHDSNNSNDSENVICLNFPLLREYKTKNCTWLNVKGVIILEVPLLEVLSIKHRGWSKSNESHTIIKFCAPRLREFSFSGHMKETILFDLDPSTTHIASAIIDVYMSDKEETAFVSCELLKQFSNNVECLKFQRSDQVLALAINDLPAFGMLTRLELGYVFTEVLLHLLRNTPFLKTLIIKGLHQSPEELLNPENVPSYFIPENVPYCFVSNLQVVNFGRLYGDLYQLRFIKFVMENAQVLEKVTFALTNYLHGSDLEQVREWLLSFKRSVTFEFIPFFYIKLL